MPIARSRETTGDAMSRIRDNISLMELLKDHAERGTPLQITAGILPEGIAARLNSADGRAAILDWSASFSKSIALLHELVYSPTGKASPKELADIADRSDEVLRSLYRRLRAQPATLADSLLESRRGSG